MKPITRTYPVPANEAIRGAALDALGIVGSPRQPEFDSVVALARQAFDVPIAMISLVGSDTQWFKAVDGLDVCGTERECAFCNYPVASGELFVVRDALSDNRFTDNCLVTGEPLIRFYAGAPLAIDPGIYVGTLCILDTKARDFTSKDATQLIRMADVVVALIKQFRDAQAVAGLNAEILEQDTINKNLSRSLIQYKRMLDRATALTKAGAWEWDLRSNEATWTDGMYSIHEIPHGEKISPDRIQASYSSASRKELERLFEKSDRELAGFTFDGQMTTAKGNKRWFRLVVDVECESGRVVRRFGMKQDITDQKAVWDHMRYLAACDPLTGLANRTALQQRLAEPVEGQGQSPASRTLLTIDVDGFKQINDSFGHATGDECLKQIAKRLRLACPKARLIARLGGDEFAVLLDTPPQEAGGERSAAEVLDQLRRPIRWHGKSFQLSGSIGVAVEHTPGDASELLIEADLALYAAKAAGRNTFRTFVQGMRLAAEARFKTVRDIAGALVQNRLELFYQPKINLAEGGLAGFEALLRWRRHNGQIIPAGSFAAALEDPELSGRIGEWVIKTALSQAKAWHRAGLQFGHIAINLSSSQFRDSTFADRLVRQISEHGLPPETIEVEVTESVFLGEANGNVLRTLEVLREAGTRIALDDFGTGYASLTHLRSYPVDIIKIDRSFVSHFMTSTRDHAILQSTLFLARHLGMEVVAEGIEETAQCEFLRALGCKYGQGYLFSKAVAAPDATVWCTPTQPKKMIA